MKQIVTINLNHICPMVTGVTPHIGGPIIGPGCPGVMVNGVPISVMGYVCMLWSARHYCTRRTGNLG